MMRNLLRHNQSQMKTKRSYQTILLINKINKIETMMTVVMMKKGKKKK